MNTSESRAKSSTATACNPPCATSFASASATEHSARRTGHCEDDGRSQSTLHPSLIALAYTIERKDYYAAFAGDNKEVEITDWLKYFTGAVLEAQGDTISRVDFYVARTKFHDRLRDQLNERQARVIARIFKALPHNGL